MIRYGLNVLGLSVIISVITAALVYFALNGLLVQPDDADHAQHAALQPEPGGRQPHHRALRRARTRSAPPSASSRTCRAELAQTLQQKSRLAALGLAVSKINHDLRNMLANAQLISDRLAACPTRPCSASRPSSSPRSAAPSISPTAR